MEAELLHGRKYFAIQTVENTCNTSLMIISELFATSSTLGGL